MATKKSNDFVGNVLEAQQNLMDTMVENAKKVANGNPILKDMVEKGTETYNDLMNRQKQAFSETKKKVEDFTKKAEKNGETVKDFYQTWLESQTDWAKKSWEANQNFLKNFTNGANKTNPMDWMNQMNQMNQFWNNWMQQHQGQNLWNNWMEYMTPTKMNNNWKEATEGWTELFNQYQELIKTSFSDLQQNMQSSTTKDAYNNMVNMASGYNKFYQLWAPFWKSIQDKTFNAEAFKKSMNAEAYKEAVDQMFGFMPDGSKEYSEQMQSWMTESLKQSMTMGKDFYNNSMSQMKAMNPFMDGTQLFSNLLMSYNQATDWFKNAVSPIARMATPNQFTKTAYEWSDIMDQMAVYQIKNAELQYMIYMTSNEVMEHLVNNISTKIEKGEKVESVMALYQEWLNISDQTFVKLFEGEAYAKLMGETSALQLKLKKEMELQMEKSMAGLPVATKSELDELYKVIYDLKKEVRQLEKMMELEEPSVKNESKTTAKKATKSTKK